MVSKLPIRSLLRLAILVVLTLAASLPEAVSPQSGLAMRPNFVVFMIDDLDTSSVAYMDAVNQRLVNQGMTFSHFFATTPLCCPARASFLRGQYAHNHGVLRNTGENAGFGAFLRSGQESVTMATLLNDAGYATALIGKYLNGYSRQGDQDSYVPPGWDYWASPIDHAAYSSFSYQLNVNGVVEHRGRGESNYLTDLLAEHALDFLDRADESGEPYFLYLAPFAPHSPSTPARRHRGMFTGVGAPRSPAFNERNMRDKPHWLRRSGRLTEARIARIDEGYALRLESLQAVDEMIARVIQRVQDQGELDSTYFIFLSDNGYFLGEYRQPHGKDAPYDPAARLPFVMSGPGISPGSTSSRIALNIDVLPTMLELAGVPTPGFVDGRSLIPLLKQDERNWRRSALIEGFGKETESIEAGESATPPFSALRTERILYVEYATGDKELYDLTEDPYMLSNLDRTSPRALKRVYKQALDRLSTCAGSACQSIEDAPLNSPSESSSPRGQKRGKRGRH